MDIFQCLQDDHRKVMAVLDQFEATTDNQARSDCVRMLMSEFLPHASGEETLVYPLLRDEAGDAEMADHALGEHHKARVLLNQICMMDCSDANLMSKVQELKACLQDHIAEEEGQIFDELRGVLDNKQATEIARQFMEYKQQCKTQEGQTFRRAA
jgi:hemerythrin superfamily protein